MVFAVLSLFTSVLGPPYKTKQFWSVLYFTVTAEPSSSRYNEATESTPLLHNSSKDGEPDEKTKKAKDTKPGVSLFKVLTKTFGWELLLSNIWKLFYDVLLFANPFLLR